MGSRYSSMECIFLNTKNLFHLLRNLHSFTIIFNECHSWSENNLIQTVKFSSTFCQKVVERELNPMIHLFYEVHERHDVLFNGHSLW